MHSCSIIVPDTSPLKTLAYGGVLDVLCKCGLSVRVVDVVVEELRAAKHLKGNQLALEFIERALREGALDMVRTGLQISALRAMGLDPGDTAIQKVLKDIYAQEDDQYSLLLFEDTRMGRTAFVLPENVYLLTTRPFLQKLQQRGILEEDAEDVLKRAEHVALSFGNPRSLLNRKREFDVPPTRDRSVRPFG
jgi:hypothetical protein